MVTCSADTTLKVLDVTTFQVLQTIRGHQNPVLSICFDNSIILSLSNEFMHKQYPREFYSYDLFSTAELVTFVKIFFVCKVEIFLSYVFFKHFFCSNKTKLNVSRSQPCYKLVSSFSNFSCMFLNPNHFFQFEF